jgi:hypothetical protein
MTAIVKAPQLRVIDTFSSKGLRSICLQSRNMLARRRDAKDLGRTNGPLSVSDPFETLGSTVCTAKASTKLPVFFPD